ncbi:kinase-like domain-containing protein [Apodospora peruviana]|uniref:Kinase-like domain-containing protein n=1 Tax=Apodospora peruviana TaxID=516989 RepID=A0AAE0I252_9PEZI|nr:kinase-like domain-containing protein [Apodospora peruviana]
MDRSESPPRIVIRVATPDPSKSITRIDSNDSDDGDLALKPTKSLHQLLRESSIQHADERIGYFWSRKILSDIMTRERVAAALHHDCDGLDLANKFGGSISALRDFILESHVQVFALLLLGDRAADIVEFTDREGGVCDKDLPLDIQLQTGKPGLFRRDDATKRVKCFDVCQWRTMELEYFYEMQWRVAVPFLALSPENGNAVHYDLPPRAILPWTRDPQDQSSDREEREGGFGSVKRVKIDSSSHGFYEPIQQAQTSTVSDYFAVKTLHLRGNPERSKEDFRREVDALKRLSQGTNHGHLIRLLATYKQDEMYHLIFPWAERDLESYWEEYNGPLMSGRSNEDNMFWIAKQITGITSALAHIHNPGPVSSSNRKYGRHGDIKPSNILCFRTNVEDQKTLVLTDFGSTSLNSQLSRSNIPARYLPRSPTYRAPECDMEGGLISRSSDIWQLGCVLLEMAAWILGGWAEVDRFTKCRTTEEITDIRSDCFFQILHKDDKFSFEVKPQVTSVRQVLGLWPGLTLSNC